MAEIIALFEYLIKNLDLKKFFYIPSSGDALHNNSPHDYYIRIGAIDRLISSDKCHYEFLVPRSNNILYVMIHFEGEIYQKDKFPNINDFFQNIGLDSYRGSNNDKRLWFYRKNTNINIEQLSSEGIEEIFKKTMKELNDLDNLIINGK